MKKIIAGIFILALAAALVVVLTAGIGPEKKTAVSVELSADAYYTAPAQAAGAEIVAAAENIVTASKKSSVTPGNARELARLTFKYDDNTTLERIVYEKDSVLYITNGKKLREIVSDDFYALADRIGRSFYKLRPVPEARVKGSALAVSQSGYAFQKLDGKFYKTQLTAGSAVRTLPLDGKKLPVPEFTVQPKTARVTVSISGEKEAVFSGALADIGKFTPSKTGDYTVKIAAEYDLTYARGEVVYEYGFNFDAEISFTADGSNTNPGEVVILRAKNIPDGAEIAVETDVEFQIKFFTEASGDRIALLPVSYYTSVGAHYIQLSCGDVVKKFAITVNDKKFDIQNMTVSAETADETINSRKANAEYEQVIAPLRKIADDKRYWNGRFIWPVKGERLVSTTFATIRYVNGAATSSRHGAIDIAVAKGTPVYASGAGRVIYAGYLQLTGNTVLIEHGYGLKTWYYHMDSLNVKTDDMIKQEQKIGEVGSTGFSTGPHLHFGMTVNNVFVNPETAITTDLFADKAD